LLPVWLTLDQPDLGQQFKAGNSSVIVGVYSLRVLPEIFPQALSVVLARYPRAIPARIVHHTLFLIALPSSRGWVGVGGVHEGRLASSILQSQRLV